MSIQTSLPMPSTQVAQDIAKLESSSRIMYETATKRGIECIIMPDYQTLLMRKNNNSWYTRGSRTSLQSSIGQTIANSKSLTKQVLASFGLPTARGERVDRTSDLEKISALTWPLVMKPDQGAHGRGVVVGIADQAEAASAFAKMKDSVMFEELLEGVEYRIVCVDFKFKAAAFRRPAFVVGDGSKNIQDLIAEKNLQPGRAPGHLGNLSFITIDGELEKVLATQELTLDSVPPAGEEVVLRKTANLSTGGEAKNVTDLVCPENKELFELIARICDLNVIGIDIMCQNLQTPIVSQAKAGVIEVNKSPGLRMHHHPSEGDSIDVASAILDMVESAIT